VLVIDTNQLCPTAASVTAAAASPFWIADNATGCSTLYDGEGAKISLQVTLARAERSRPRRSAQRRRVCRGIWVVSEATAGVPGPDTVHLDVRSYVHGSLNQCLELTGYGKLPV
jgi:hypothetical protein